MQACDLALHFSSRLMQYVLFNALEVEYHVVLFYLRKIVEAWKDNKYETRRHLDLLNEFKAKADCYENFQGIWQTLLKLDEASLTTVQRQFMMMLARHEMLDYALRIPSKEKQSDFIQGETNLTNNSEDSEDGEISIYSNRWRTDMVGRLSSGPILLQVFTHKHMLIVPIKWEGSIAKLFRISFRDTLQKAFTMT